jgi:hypothetical protein
VLDQATALKIEYNRKSKSYQISEVITGKVSDVVYLVHLGYWVSNDLVRSLGLMYSNRDTTESWAPAKRAALENWLKANA